MKQTNELIIFFYETNEWINFIKWTHNIFYETNEWINFIKWTHTNEWIKFIKIMNEFYKINE